MRLVIDLQGAQGSSRLRGIGRFSRELALAMVRDRGDHEVILALNGRFADAADELLHSFAQFLPREAMRVWQPVGGTAAVKGDSAVRRLASDQIRARFLSSLAPDVIHVSSLFEGVDDDVVTGVPPDATMAPTAATLYDLIPFIRRDQYLDGAWSGSAVRDWYMRCLEQLRKLPGLLAISESSRNEAIEHLGMPGERIFNIRAGITEAFRPVRMPGPLQDEFLRRYRLPEKYVLFLGGGDMRKNEAGLIKAYALLPADIREAYRLVIVAKVNEADLRSKAAAAGLAANELILIPFVAEIDLPVIYSLCSLFVFPSFHEGFGLPAAEAMACGAPVIGSNCSSLPEVIGRPDALFDPNKPASIAELMHRVLSDDDFRQSLAETGVIHARSFTWAESARRAWSALEAIHDHTKAPSHNSSVSREPVAPRRKSLAITSPLPPVKSGISDYTAQLLASLAKFYVITLVTTNPADADHEIRAHYEIISPNEFSKRAVEFDRVIHQIGNSEFHRFQFDLLLPLVPGIMVLHDVFLSNVHQYVDAINGTPENFRKLIFLAHGIPGWKAAHQSDAEAVQLFPCSLMQIRQSLGVIVHSDHAKSIINNFYGHAVSNKAQVISTTRNLPPLPSREAARQRLNLSPDAFVVATFGGVANSKMPDVILDAYARTKFASVPSSLLAYVGEAETIVGESIHRLAQAAGVSGSVVQTGRVSTETYLDWLAAVDVAIQLRKGSRGETSAAAADCLAAGLPTIVNAHGSLAELPQHAVIMLPDSLAVEDLAKSLEMLALSALSRLRLGSSAREWASANLDPDRVAASYFTAIEQVYGGQGPGLVASQVLRAIGPTPAPAHGAEVVRPTARALVASFPEPRPRRLMLDVSGVLNAQTRSAGDWGVFAAALLTNAASGDRGELVDWQEDAAVSVWSRAAAIVGVPPLDDAASARPMIGDMLFIPLLTGKTGTASTALARWARRGGAGVTALELTNVFSNRLNAGIDFDSVICIKDTMAKNILRDDERIIRKILEPDDVG